MASDSIVTLTQKTLASGKTARENEGRDERAGKIGTTDKGQTNELRVALTTHKSDWILIDDLSTSSNELSTPELNVMADTLQKCLSRFPRNQSLKPEQIEVLEAVIAGCDVLAISPTGFGKSLIYQVFCQANLSSNPKASVLVISLHNSTVVELRNNF